MSPNNSNANSNVYTPCPGKNGPPKQNDTIRYDTIDEINVDSKAEYTA